MNLASDFDRKSLLRWLTKEVGMFLERKDVVSEFPASDKDWRQVNVVTRIDSHLDLGTISTRVLAPMAEALSSRLGELGIKTVTDEGFLLEPEPTDRVVASSKLGMALCGSFYDHPDGLLFRADVLGHA